MRMNGRFSARPAACILHEIRVRKEKGIGKEMVIGKVKSDLIQKR